MKPDILDGGFRALLTRRLCAEPTSERVAWSAPDTMVPSETRQIAKRSDLLREGDRVDHLYVITDGWGCRYKSSSDGARQIIGFLIPGDMCNPEHVHGIRSNYAVGAISKLTVAACRLTVVEKLIERDGRIGRSIQSDAARMSDRERSWLLNIGQRDAVICVAHLLCELIERLDGVRMLRGGACAFPIAQHDIAAATGLSDVHVNRTLGELRRRGLVSLKGRTLAVINRAQLEALCLFEPTPRPTPYFSFDGV